MVTTSTWTSGISAGWSVAGDWTPSGAPDSNTIAVLINAPAFGGPSSYTVTISGGEQFATAGVTINNAAATLSIAGLLDLNGGPLLVQQGLVALNGGTIFNGNSLSGLVSGTGQFFGFATLTNSGTIQDNSGNLFVLGPLTNTGTIMTGGPGGAFLGIEGSAFTNLSGGTLTGGTYIAQGSGNLFNILGIAINGDATVTTDAATLILDGQAAAIDGAVGGSFVSIATQLRNVAPTGSLQLLNRANFADTGALADAGNVALNGGTFSSTGLSVSGTFQGWGFVNGGVTNTGTIIANGGTQGALDVTSTIAGIGALVVNAASSLLLRGASASSLTNNGTVYNTGGLLNIGTLTGGGTIVAYNGSTVEIGGAASQSLVFGGAAATVRLDNPLTFTGTLGGFGGADSLFAADQLVLAGMSGTSAQIVNNNTLAVISGGTTLDTVVLSGNYTGATFSTSLVGGATVVRPLAGAPVRDGLKATVSLTDQAGLDVTTENNIVADLQAALARWGQYITGAAPLRIALTITNTTNGAIVASAGPATTTPSGVTIGGKSIVTPSSMFALNSGNYVQGSTSDINVSVLGGGTNIASLYINPTPSTPGTVPAGKIDLLSILTHEIAHGLGFIGLIDSTTGVAGANIELFDQNLQIATTNGTVSAATFMGANAEAAYATLIGTNVATPVPMNSVTPGSQLYHVANLSSDPLGNDLMFPSLPQGVSRSISSVDLAILRDSGIVATAGVACYAAGTRIATPDSETTVEALRMGDLVRTLDGAARPVRWVGWRKIQVTRHREPSLVRPIVVEANAFAIGRPARALRLSPDHGIFVDGALVPARLLVNGTSIRIDTRCRTVTYYHIELDSHDIVLAEGLPAESYLETGHRHMYANGGTTIALHPDFAARVWEMEGCAPLVQTGPRLDAIRANLPRPRTRAAPGRANRRAS